MQKLEKILEEIEKLKEMYKESALSLIDKGNLPCEYDKSDIESAKMQAISEAITIIRKHMNDGWIPVEKDLPKNESEVWVVLESTYGTGYRTYSSARYLYFENYGESHWCDEHYGYLEWDKYSDGHGGSSQYKVIAWQSIAPYRPERSNNHDREGSNIKN